MSSDKELLEQIALLAGAINKHKMKMEDSANRSYSAPSSPSKSFSYGTSKLNNHASGNNQVEEATSNYIRKGNKLIRLNEAHGSATLKNTLYTPQGNTATISASGPLHVDKPQTQIPVSRHRTLVVQPVSGSNEAIPSVESQQSGWVQKRNRHMQLINAAVHAKRTEEFKKSKPNIINLTPRGTSVLIDGTKYKRGPAGNKLVIAKEGVKGNEVTVGGVVFVMDPSGQRLIRKKQDILSKRTRGGNLMTVKNPALLQHKHRYSKDPFLPLLTRVKPFNLIDLCCFFGSSTKRLLTSNKRSKYCQYFNRFGRCSKGTKCPFVHDPQRVAICTKFLRGACENPEECPFSHDITPERVPLCYHFQKGKCTNQDCPYLHVKVNPDAPVCKAFLTEGFCSNGKSCKERHVWECPDFAANGICENSKCKLPHVVRGQKRNSSQLLSDSVDNQEDGHIPSEARYKIQPNFTNALEFSSQESDTEEDQETEEVIESELDS